MDWSGDTNYWSGGAGDDWATDEWATDEWATDDWAADDPAYWASGSEDI